jgi:serine O-acetyltransferase
LTSGGQEEEKILFRQLREDVQAVFERDPAAKSLIEVLLCYPGLHALVLHRLAHALYRRRFYVPARLVSHVSRFLTGIEIHPGARLGRRVFIDHGSGVVIGETAVVGDDVTIYQGVTLGGTGQAKGKRHPTIEDRCVIGVGAKVLGAITVGRGSRVGAGAVTLKDVPPGCTVVGVPGRIVVRDGERVDPLEHGKLPDPVADALREERATVRRLEARLEDLERELRSLGQRLAAPDAGRPSLDGPDRDATAATGSGPAAAGGR